jgi:hypothetical protein
MSALRPDQERLLATHRKRAADRLEAVISGTPGGDPRLSGEGQALLEEDPELLVSVAVRALELRCEYSRAFHERAQGGVIFGGARVAVPHVLLSVLRRRRLPWTPADAELLLDLAAGVAVDELAFAVATAERVLADHPGDPAVYRALSAAGPALDAMKLHQGGSVGRLRQRIRTLVGASAPGGLLDLSLLQEGDDWVGAASAAANEHAARWDRTQELLSHLAGARGARPSERWVAQARELLESSAEGPSLARSLLEPVLRLEPAPGKPLLTAANERIVCGAAWAVGVAPSTDSVSLLRDVVLACAGPGRTAARAAVEGLVLAGTPAATEALHTLLADVSRVSIRERIAEVVETTATPRHRRAEAVRSFGAAVLDALSARGFSDRRRRECYRYSIDRVEVVEVGSDEGAPRISVGVAFAVARHGRVGRPKWQYCDLTGVARLADGDADVEASVADALAWFERWSDPAAVIEFLVPSGGAKEFEGFETAGSRGLGSPGCDLIVGYLAADAGRPELVRPCLERVVEHYRHLLESSVQPDPDLAARIERIESDIERIVPE